MRQEHTLHIHAIGQLLCKCRRVSDVNEIAVGNYGYLRDRYGIDVNVRIQSYTRYRDRDTTQTDTVTFGNKIFGIDEWNNRENQANAALHKAPKKPETVTPPVTFDDIQTINVQKESEENG